MKQKSQKISFLQKFFFTDVTSVMKRLKRQTLEKPDLASLPAITKRLQEQERYLPFSEALGQFRKSPFLGILRAEKLYFLKMFFIHVIDVSISLFSALFAIQILKSFEAPVAGQGLSYFRFIDIFFTNPSTTEAVLFTLCLVGSIFVMNVAVASLHAQKIEREAVVEWRVSTRLSSYMYEFLLKMSRSSRQHFDSGEITNRAQNDARMMGSFFAHCFVDLPVLVASCTLVMGIMLALMGPIAWIGLGVILLQVPISMASSYVGSYIQRNLMKRSDQRLQTITEWIQGMRLVRYFGWGPAFEKEIAQRTKSEFNQTLKNIGRYSVVFSLTSSWWMFVSSALFAGILYMNGNKQPSAIFGAIWLSSILGQQLTPLPWFVNMFSQARVGSQRLKEFFQLKTQEETFPNQVTSSFLSPHDQSALEDYLLHPEKYEIDVGFQMNHVSFFFAEDEESFEQKNPLGKKYLFKNLNLFFEPKKLTAIIGTVGSGKSTLLQMLMGELPPTEGTVELAIHLKNLSTQQISFFKLNLYTEKGLKVLRNNQSFVPQEAFIFSATIRENIPMSYAWSHNFSYDDREIINALHAASLEEDLKEFSHHIDTEIGERGVNLSGGQKQRLSLARSVFANRQVIFLDDPFSAVDAHTEEALVSNIFQEHVLQQKTIIWVTHRLTHLGLAHQVIRLEKGQVFVETET